MSTSVAPDLETFTAEEVLAHCVAEYHPRLAVATSFQKEASVIMDMLVKIEPTVRFFTLDTHALFPETRAIWQRVQEHYGIEIEGVEGEIIPDLCKTDTERCCDLRKVRPLRDTLSKADGWVSGVRREQSVTRAETRKLDWDAKHGLWKANPLADWTEKDVWRYIFANDVPYHELHDRGYASIGCEPCTAPGDARDGALGRVDQGRVRHPRGVTDDVTLASQPRAPFGRGHGLADRPVGLGEVVDRRRARGAPARRRPRGLPARRRQPALRAQRRPRLLRRRPRRERAAHGRSRPAVRRRRPRRHRLARLPLPRRPRPRTGDPRRRGPAVPRGLRRHRPGGLRGPRPQGPLPPRPSGRDHRPDRDRRPLRAARCTPSSSSTAASEPVAQSVELVLAALRAV